jgi:hypothetical protein
MGASAARLHGFYAPVGIMLDKSRICPESTEDSPLAVLFESRLTDGSTSPIRETAPDE